MNLRAVRTTAAMVALAGALVALPALAGRVGPRPARPDGQQTATVTSTLTATVTATASVTTTATVSATVPTPTSTDTPAPTATPTRTPFPSATPLPTATPCPLRTPPPTDLRVEVQVGGNLVRGRTLPDSAVSATVSDAGGRAVSAASGRSDPTGAFALELMSADGTQPIGIQPGWRVHVSAPNGSADVTAVALRLFIDTNLKRVLGDGPADAELRLRLSFGFDRVELIHTDASGKFVWSWIVAREPEGGAWAELYHDAAPGRTVFARDRIASVLVQLDSPLLTVTAPPMSHVSASVEGPNRFLLATVAGTANGWGQAVFHMTRQSSGQPLPLAPGLTVIATSSSEEVTHRVNVEELTGFITPGGRDISGTAPPSQIVTARLAWPEDALAWCAPTFEQRQGVSNQAGAYTIPLRASRGTRPLPRPLDELARIILSYETRYRDEVQREIPVTYVPVARMLFLPRTLRDF